MAALMRGYKRSEASSSLQRSGQNSFQARRRGKGWEVGFRTHDKEI